MKKRGKVKPAAWCPAPPCYGPYGRAWRGAGAYPLSPFADSEANNGFARGFIAAGLIAAVGAKRLKRKEILKSALQNGTALAAGIAGANAIDRRDYGSVLVAIAAGAVGLSAIDRLFPDTPSSTERNSYE